MKPSSEMMELSAWSVLAVGVGCAVGLLVGACVGGEGDRLVVTLETDVCSNVSRDC